MSYWSVEIETPSELTDWLSWLLAERLDVAVEIQDDETLTLGPDPDVYRIIVRSEEEPTPEWVRMIHDCLDEVGYPQASLRSRHEEDDSWRLGWRAFFKPTSLAEGVIVRPPWSESSDAEVEIIIDPGLAFGTGTHATTQLAASLLKSQLDSATDYSVLDQGCGSGILSLLAAKLGHRVLGIELDAMAVGSAQDNLPLNHFPEGQVSIEVGDRIPEADFDLIVMNIIAPVLIDLAPQVERSTAHSLILSGLLNDQESQVLRAYQAWQVSHREIHGEWVGLILHRKNTSEGS
jgi:ribosomal protein L11 methyltransferase